MTHLARLVLSLTSSLLMVGILALPATAALQRFEMKRQQLNQNQARSPKASYEAFPGILGVALLDESGASPILRRFVMGDPGSTQTVVLPALTGFAWFGLKSLAGPNPNQTGTGGSASSIVWGNVDGWTTSGASFCHSVPSYLCGLANYIDNQTIPSVNASTNYDNGRWTFHGTGFTNPVGRIIFTAPNNPGNVTHFERGSRRDSGAVPALPLIGIASVGLSVIALGIASRRRSR